MKKCNVDGCNETNPRDEISCNKTNETLIDQIGELHELYLRYWILAQEAIEKSNNSINFNDLIDKKSKPNAKKVQYRWML